MHAPTFFNIFDAPCSCYLERLRQTSSHKSKVSIHAPILFNIIDAPCSFTLRGFVKLAPTSPSPLPSCTFFLAKLVILHRTTPCPPPPHEAQGFHSHRFHRSGVNPPSINPASQLVPLASCRSGCTVGHGETHDPDAGIYFD